MKKIILTLLIIAPVLASAQYKQYGDFSYTRDTILFNGIKIAIGDTVQLGFGSGINHKFIFVFQQTVNMKKYVKMLPAPIPQMASVKLILKRIDIVGDLVEPIFGHAQTNERIEWTAQLTNATQTKELILKNQ